MEDAANSMDGYLAALDINEAVAKLKPREQELVRLHTEGYTRKEIAKIFAFSQGYITRLIQSITKKVAAASV